MLELKINTYMVKKYIFNLCLFKLLILKGSMH